VDEVQIVGLGDELLASGRARRLHEKTGKRVCIVDRRGSPRWHEIWDGVDFLSKNLGQDVVTLADGPGCRPYIAGVRCGKVIFKLDHVAIPGTIAIRAEHQYEAAVLLESLGPVVIVEPGFKGTNSADNKDWGWHNWVTLSTALMVQGIKVVQLALPGRKELPDVAQIYDEGVHGFAACVKQASLVITTEGGMHHTAAAVNTAAVVIWGGFTSPEFLGYLGQANIYDDHEMSPCGSRGSCPHCRERMNAISVERVLLIACEEIREKEKTKSWTTT